MDEDDIYGSILSEPKSHTSNNSGMSSTSNSYVLPASNSRPEYHHSLDQHQSTNGYTAPGGNFPTPWLFASNLTWWTNEDDIRGLLSESLNTRILSVHFIEHKPNGKSKGMAIIEFRDIETAEMAKEMIEGKEIYGKRCEIGFAKNPPMKPFESKFNYFIVCIYILILN